MDQKKEIGTEEMMGRISRLTQTLLEDGADPAQLAFALTSVAADMGLQVAGDPLKVFPVLLEAIANQASKRVDLDEAQADHDELEVPPGATVH